jgi:Putative Ig domain
MVSPTTTTIAGSTTTTTVAPSPTTTVAPPSDGFRIITTSPLPNANVGTEYTAFIEACCGNGTPYRWSLVAGRVPARLRFVGDDFRLTRTTGVVGTPTTVETTSFTVGARDGAGARTRRAFTITVDPPLPLEITNQGDTLAPGVSGQVHSDATADLWGRSGRSAVPFPSGSRRLITAFAPRVVSRPSQFPALP